jgi:hypothetical protein
VDVFLKTEFDERRALFSPDGRWIAYQSNESGRLEIYVRPFPEPGGQWQASTANRKSVAVGVHSLGKFESLPDESPGVDSNNSN